MIKGNKMEVIKRSGEVVEFDPDKIYQAILKAAQTVYVLTDDLRQNLAQVTKKSCFGLGRSKSRTCDYQYDSING